MSSTPVETHVFLSLLHKLPFYVSTSEGIVWEVNDGKITRKVLKDANAPKEKMDEAQKKVVDFEKLQARRRLLLQARPNRLGG